MATFQARMIGAMKLDAAAFEDVEHDRAATGQAALVVTLAALATAVPLLHYGLGMGLSMIVTRLLGWFIGAVVLLIVGTKLFPGRNTEADLGQMLRTLGFAQAAGVFAILGVLPIVGGLVEVLVSIWILVALVVAVRQALDYDDTSRALIVCVVAWLFMFAVSAVGRFFGLAADVATRPGL